MDLVADPLVARDSPREAGAPEAEIDVTPPMIEAGLGALMGCYQDLVWPELDAYPGIVETVYRAMAGART